MKANDKWNGGENVMNKWTEQSIKLAEQDNYLDKLYSIYPIKRNPRRQLSDEKKDKIRKAHKERNVIELITNLLDLDLFPIKDSFVAYLKKDRTAISRNPQNIERIGNILFDMDIEEILYKCTEPKESNRQMGPMFKKWIDKENFGAPVFRNAQEFLNCTDNCIFNSSDKELKKFAKEYLGYNRDKGIDFIAKFNEKYVIAETKFLTDFGGHQNAQFNDAVNTMQTSFKEKTVANEVVPIAILDGVLYIKGQNKMYNYLQNNPDQIIISALLLKEFLNSI